MPRLLAVFLRRLRSAVLPALLLSLGVSATLSASAQAQAATAPRADRIEPPSWWVGMAEPRLQLMIHGPGVGALRPALNYPGVRIAAVQTVASPNYLFVDLDISPQAKPGELPLLLQAAQGSQAPLRINYSLRPRAQGSAQRQGFGPKDAVYLLVPDRFAKAGASTAPAGMREAEQRSDPNGRHGGNLAGLRQHLDYIAGLGFTQIWPTPLIENNSPKASYHGYGATDFYRIDPRFGSQADYLALVSEARERGLGVIQDIVLNHIGSNHWWMADLPAPDWLNQWPAYTQTQHARSTLLDGHAAPSDRHLFTNGWFVPEMPDLNQRHPLLANYLTQMSVWWVEQAGLSGLRVDTFSYSDKQFLARWSARLMQEYPNFNLVGEEWSPSPAIVAYWQRGKRNHDGYQTAMPSMMDFPLHGALLAGLTQDESWEGGLNKLYDTLAHDFLYPNPAQLMLFTGNHDTPRLFTALKSDPALFKMAMLYLATVQRIPQFFAGDELLQTSPAQRDDGAVRADFPGGWAGDAVNAFTGQGLSPAQREAQDLVRRLMNWRKQSTLAQRGELMHYTPKDGSYVLFRHLPGQSRKLMLVFNKNTAPISLDTRRFAEMLTPKSSGTDVLSGARHALDQTLQVPARSGLLMEVDN